MKLPASVRIANYVYSIEYVGSTQEVDDNLISTELLGLANHSTNTIRILAAQQPIGVLDTLIHEILHALFRCNDLLKTAIRPEIGAEAFISSLGVTLANLLIDNKWIQMPKRVAPTIKRITF